MGRRLLSTILSLTLAALMLPIASVPAYAQEEELAEVVDISENLVQSKNFNFTGNVPDGYSDDRYLALSDETARIIETRVAQAIKNYDEKVKIDDLEIPLDDTLIPGSKNTVGAKNITDPCFNAMNNNPMLFYGPKSITIGISTEAPYIYTSLNWKYTESISTIETKVAQAQAGADAYLSGIDSSWTDEQKLLYFHDKMVTDCIYDSSSSRPDESYNAYGIFVTKRAVCNGYALAYKYLMNEVNIDNYLVRSGQLNHIWNSAKLDGKDYLIDVTWDDPLVQGTTNDFGPNLTCYRYFLKSASEFGHVATDWTFKGPPVHEGSTSGYFTDTKYNDFWTSQGVNSKYMTAPYKISGKWASQSGNNHYSGKETSVVIPETINGASTAYINAKSFWRNDSITKVTLSKAATTLLTDAFYYCPNLTTIVVPSKTTTLNTSAFRGCSKLTTIVGYKNSTAETFAKANGYTFKDISAAPEGDISGDGSTTVADIVLLKRIIATGGTSGVTGCNNPSAADVNKDEKFTVADIVALKKIIAAG